MMLMMMTTMIMETPLMVKVYNGTTTTPPTTTHTSPTTSYPGPKDKKCPNSTNTHCRCFDDWNIFWEVERNTIGMKLCDHGTLPKLKGM